MNNLTLKKCLLSFFAECIYRRQQMRKRKPSSDGRRQASGNEENLPAIPGEKTEFGGPSGVSPHQTQPAPLIKPFVQNRLSDTIDNERVDSRGVRQKRATNKVDSTGYLILDKILHDTVSNPHAHESTTGGDVHFYSTRIESGGGGVRESKSNYDVVEDQPGEEDARLYHQYHCQSTPFGKVQQKASSCLNAHSKEGDVHYYSVRETESTKGEVTKYERKYDVIADRPREDECDPELHHHYHGQSEPFQAGNSALSVIDSGGYLVPMKIYK